MKIIHILRATTIPTDGAIDQHQKAIDACSSTPAKAPLVCHTHSICQESPTSSPIPDYSSHLAGFTFNSLEESLFADIWQERPESLMARVVRGAGEEASIHLFRIPIADRPDAAAVLRALADRLDTARNGGTI